jgi:DNA-directed RNA polymerase subunit RPC12/RpoP
MKAELGRLGASAEGCATPEDCLQRLLEFQAALEAATTEQVPPAAAPALAPPLPPGGLVPPADEALRLARVPAGCVRGGRDVDAHHVNAGVLRCPRCGTRLITKKAVLVERWFGGGGGSSGGPDGSCGGGAFEADQAAADADGAANGLPLATPTGPGGCWAETRYRWWWRLADHNDFDAVGMSAVHATPADGSVRYPLCPECLLGPLGLQQQSPQAEALQGKTASAAQDAHAAAQAEAGACHNEVLVACALVSQQPLSLANDTLDFAAPAHLAGGALAQLLAQVRRSRGLKMRGWQF